MDPISVAVERGDLVESRHRVHAVQVANGEIVAVQGDPELVTFIRSAAKPFQALLLVREYEDLSDEEIAIASASHEARPEQLAAVESLLERAGATEDELACGPVAGSRLRHNCSGKHAGMLCVCSARGWTRDGYHTSAHPLQRACLEEVSEVVDLEPEEIPLAVDGCGVVTFALALERMASAFSGLARGDRTGSERLTSAMQAHPLLVGGETATDTRLMQALPGAVAKRGAEGVLCAALPDGSGLALKVEDGAQRALLPATGEFLGLEQLGEETLRNSRGETVGKVRVVL